VRAGVEETGREGGVLSRLAADTLTCRERLKVEALGQMMRK
jgi:hypothetical protein